MASRWPLSVLLTSPVTRSRTIPGASVFSIVLRVGPPDYLSYELVPTTRMSSTLGTTLSSSARKTIFTCMVL